MAMTRAQMRAYNNPVLVGLLLGASNDAASYVGANLFQQLPQSLSSMAIMEMGNAHMQRYRLRRAPGAPTTRIEIKWSDRIVALDQDAVEVLFPREVIRELDESRRLNVGLWMEASQVAMATCRSVVDLSYEIDCSELAADPNTYDSGMVYVMSGGAKWSASTGTPVTDIRAAIELVRTEGGRRANRVTFSAKDFAAVCTNPEVKSYLPNTATGPATLDQLKIILGVPYIDVGDATYQDDDGSSHDVWQGTTVVSYTPPISTAASFSLGEPRFGVTSVMEGHPLAETPYFENSRKSWVYGATYERRPNVLRKTSAFLFKNAS